MTATATGLTVSTRRRIADTDVHVTALGLGGCPFGGMFTPVPRDQAVDTIHAARDLGIGYIDTAPHYGSGRSEQVIAEALHHDPTCVLSTKVGRRLRPLPPGGSPGPAMFTDTLPYEQVWDWSADGIRKTLEDSLSRLGRDRVDIVYLHDPDGHEDDVYATGYPTLAKLREEGIVGAIGAGMNQTAMLTRFVRRLDLDVVLCAGRYSVLDRQAQHDLLPACRETRTSVIAAGVFNSGLLANPTSSSTFNYRTAPPALVHRAQAMADACAAHDVPLKAAALQFPQRHPAITATVIGCRHPHELTENVELFHLPIPEALWATLETLQIPHSPSHR